MQPEVLTAMLKSLKPYGMAHAITDLAGQASPAYHQLNPRKYRANRTPERRHESRY
jgi:hypothetical protein